MKTQELWWIGVLGLGITMAANAIADEDAPVRGGEGWSALQRIEDYAEEQDGLFKEFQSSKSEAFKARNAYILSELWSAGLLKEELKSKLAEEHFQLVLLQIYGNFNAPNFVVRCHQTFPFPAAWTEFTPILYVNNEVAWAPDKPQKENAMSVNNCTITSRIGGLINNGDVLQYKIVLCQRNREPGGNMEPVWRKELWSNKVVVRGLKPRMPEPKLEPMPGLRML